MLTLKEIEEVRLGKARVGGYKAEDVDKFIDEVRDSFEKLQNDNAELVSKIKVLAHRVNEYRTQEESVRNALMKAQKIEDDAIKEAKTKMVADVLKTLEAGKKPLIVSSKDAKLDQASRNIAGLNKMVPSDLNAYAVLNSTKVIITKEALEKMSK